MTDDTKTPPSEALPVDPPEQALTQPTGIHLTPGTAPPTETSPFETFRNALCQSSASVDVPAAYGELGPMALRASSDFWTAVQWLRKWSVVHPDHNVASFLAVLTSFFDDWRGTAEEAAALQIGGLGSIVLDLRGLFQRRSDDLSDSAEKAGRARELLAMAGFYARSLALRAVVHLCDATRRIVRSRTWSPLISDAWELAVDDLVTMAAIDVAMARIRANEEAWKESDGGPIDPEDLGHFCGSFTRAHPAGEQYDDVGTRQRAIELFLAVVEEHRMAGDAARVCWKDGCTARVARGAFGCESHPFEAVMRERVPGTFRHRDRPSVDVPGLSPKAIETMTDAAIRQNFPPRDRELDASIAMWSDPAWAARQILDKSPELGAAILNEAKRRAPRREQAFDRLVHPADERYCWCGLPAQHPDACPELDLTGVEPCGPGLWWAHVELNRPDIGHQRAHFRVVADSPGGAVVLAQSIEHLSPSFVVNALRDRPFTVLAPDDIAAIRALAAKEGAK